MFNFAVFSGLSYPFLHWLFVVGHRLRDTFVLKLEDGINEDQDAQRENAWYYHSNRIYGAWYIIYGNHDVNILIGEVPVLVLLHFCLVATHPILKDRFWVAWFHSKLLVVKLPVVFSLVEVSVNWKVDQEDIIGRYQI